MTRMLFPAALILLAACAPEAPMPSAEDGARLFADHCAACHGATATGGRGPDLTKLARTADGSFPRAAVLSQIDGYQRGPQSGDMPEFGLLTEDAPTVPVLIDGRPSPVPRPMAAVLAYLELIQTP